jgi:hypothetical protein
MSIIKIPHCNLDFIFLLLDEIGGAGKYPPHLSITSGLWDPS